MPRKLKIRKGETIPHHTNYKMFIDHLKEKIKSSQLKAFLSINREMTSLYWEIGKDLLETQEKYKWGTKDIQKIATDLQKEFPGIEGFSKTNLYRMRSFYLAYPTIPQNPNPLNDLPVFHIPWGHNVILLTKVKDLEIRLWYAKKTIENGWTRDVLELWIDSNLHKREGKAITNFQNTLPKPQSDLAQQAMRDPYLIDFMMATEDAKEKEIEQGLIENLQNFLMELGEGFAFIGRQVPLTVEGDTSYLDLLFYNTKLHCYVVLEIKARAFDPRDTGQLNYYIGAVEKQLRREGDNATIGILLCRTKKELKVEYAISNLKNPISVSTYEFLVKSLPKGLKPTIPTVAQIEAELSELEAPESSETKKITKNRK